MARRGRLSTEGVLEEIEQDDFDFFNEFSDLDDDHADSDDADDICHSPLQPPPSNTHSSYCPIIHLACWS